MQTMVMDRDQVVVAVIDSDVDRPELDEFGLLRYHGRWVALSSTEERAVRPLLDRWRRVVPRRDLVESVWPGTGARTTALHTALARLRRRVRPLGLDIETIRARGFVMAPQPDSEPEEGSSWLTS